MEAASKKHEQDRTDQPLQPGDLLLINARIYIVVEIDGELRAEPELGERLYLGILNA